VAPAATAATPVATTAAASTPVPAATSAATPTTRPVPPAAAQRAPAAKPGVAANEALAVDPTDVAMRMQAHRRAREQRTRRVAAASALTAAVVVASAAAVWLEPTWRPLLGSPHVQLAATAPATPAAVPRDEPAVALPPPNAPADADAAPPRAAPTDLATEAVQAALPPAAATRSAEPVASPKTQPASTDAVVATRPAPSQAIPAASAPSRSPTSTSLAAAAATAGAAASSRKTQETRAAAPARGRSAEPTSRTTLARNGRSALAFPAPSGVARSSATGAAAGRPSASPSSRSAPPVRRYASTSARPVGGSAIPWAVAGRTAARDTLVKGSGERGALLPLSPRLADSTPTRGAETGRSGLVNVNSASNGSAGAPSSTPANAAPNAFGAPATAAPAPPTALAVIARPPLSADGARPPLSADVAAPARTSTASATAPAADSTSIDFAARASDLMANQMPRLAQRAERQIARVLFVAGRSERGGGDAEVRAAAAAVGRDGGDALAGVPVSAREAQRLGDAARAEYARRGGTPEALALQARAFGADPLDVEAAGNLAFLLLRQRPAQAEAARQLALHALSVHGPRYPEGRIEDWATFAIASALAGRERDATNAFLVTLSLATNLERHCKAALDVYAIYGERLRAPIEAMLQSANASGRANGSAFCEWPPHWVVSGAR